MRQRFLDVCLSTDRQPDQCLRKAPGARGIRARAPPMRRGGPAVRPMLRRPNSASRLRPARRAVAVGLGRSRRVQRWVRIKFHCYLLPRSAGKERGSYAASPKRDSHPTARRGHPPYGEKGTSTLRRNGDIHPTAKRGHPPCAEKGTSTLRRKGDTHPTPKRGHPPCAEKKGTSALLSQSVLGETRRLC